MRILAIETSTSQGSIALLQHGELVVEFLLPRQQRTAQSLSPAMRRLLEHAGWPPRTIDSVAVTSGPGSFTGLRIAVTAAKTFAYACEASLVAVNTLQVLVEQLPSGVLDACAVMDAQRRQLFAARNHRESDQRWKTVCECCIVPQEDLTGLLAPTTVLTGPILERLGPSYLPDQPRSSPELWYPRAATVGRLGWQAWQAGRSDDLYRLTPRYYRSSYAEEHARD